MEYVVNMTETVREFNIAQESIVSTVMYMYVVFLICLYYLGSLFYHSHVSNACQTCKVFKDCLFFIKTKIFSDCKCFGYA